VDPDQVISKTTARMLGESFLVGFASTAGMLTIFAIVANRKKIVHIAKREFHVLTHTYKDAVQEAR
jgi:hypothetical protein